MLWVMCPNYVGVGVSDTHLDRVDLIGLVDRWGCRGFQRTRDIKKFREVQGVHWPDSSVCSLTFPDTK